jgi:hypothetical protein
MKTANVKDTFVELVTIEDPVAQFGLCGQGEVESGEVGGAGPL